MVNGIPINKNWLAKPILTLTALRAKSTTGINIGVTEFVCSDAAPFKIGIFAFFPGVTTGDDGISTIVSTDLGGAWIRQTFSIKLDVNGKIDQSQLPDITINEVFVVNSEAEMLALDAQAGDVAVRTDESKSYILKVSQPTILANWQELLQPPAIPLSYLDTDGTLSANSDTKVPSQKAVKTYVDSKTSFPIGVTKEYSIDNNRIDAYIEDGSIIKPYKTEQAAINAAAALNDSIIGFAFRSKKGIYAENLLLENAGLHYLVFLGESGTLIEPSSGNALQSTVNNNNLSQLYIDSMDFNGDVVLTGAGYGFLNGECCFKNCYFYTKFSFSGYTPSNSSILRLIGNYFGGDVSVSNINDCEICGGGVGIDGQLKLINSTVILDSVSAEGGVSIDSSSILKIRNGSYLGANGSGIIVNGNLYNYGCVVHQTLTLNAGATLYDFGGSYATIIDNGGTRIDMSPKVWGAKDFQDIATYAGTPSFTLGSQIPNVDFVRAPMTDALEPTGFVDRTANLSFVDSTRRFTITGNHDIYIKGVKSTKTTAFIDISNTVGLHFIYYNSSGVLSESTSIPPLYYPFVASVYWDGTKGAVGEERHGIVMDWATHLYLHLTVGSRYSDGLAGTFNNATFSIGAGSFFDEDIRHQFLSELTQCRIFYKNGSADFTFDIAQAPLYKAVTGTIQYNNGNALANVSISNYVAYWVFATNDINTPIMSLMGQRQDTTLANAQNNNTYGSLVFGQLPYSEAKLLYRVIFRNVAGTPTFIEAQDLRNLNNLPSGTYLATSHNTLSDLQLAGYSISLGHINDAAQSIYGEKKFVSDYTDIHKDSVSSPSILNIYNNYLGQAGSDTIISRITLGTNGSSVPFFASISAIIKNGSWGDQPILAFSTPLASNDNTQATRFQIRSNGLSTLSSVMMEYDFSPTFSSDNQIITKKYVDDKIPLTDYWQRNATTIAPATIEDTVVIGAKTGFSLAQNSQLTVYGAGNNSGAAAWIGSSFSGALAACGRDRVVIGTLKGWATIGAHNYQLNDWADIVIGDVGKVGIGSFAQKPILISVSSITGVSGTITVVCQTAHQLVAGNTFTLSGITDPVGMNGSQTVATVIDQYTLTFTYLTWTGTATGTIILEPYYSGTESIKERLDLRGNMYTTGNLRFSQNADTHNIYVDRSLVGTVASLKILGQGGRSGGKNQSGGVVTIQGGISTGSGISPIEFGTYLSGESGTSDNTYATAFSICNTLTTNGTGRFNFQGSGTSKYNRCALEFLSNDQAAYPIAGQYYNSLNDMIDVYDGYCINNSVYSSYTNAQGMIAAFVKESTQFDIKCTNLSLNAGSTVTLFSRVRFTQYSTVFNGDQQKFKTYFGSVNAYDSILIDAASNGSLLAYLDSFTIQDVAKTVNLLACQSSTLGVQIEGTNLTIGNLPSLSPDPGEHGRIWADSSGYVRVVL